MLFGGSGLLMLVVVYYQYSFHILYVFFNSTKKYTTYKASDNWKYMTDNNLSLAHVGGLVHPPEVFLSYTPNRFR